MRRVIGLLTMVCVLALAASAAAAKPSLKIGDLKLSEGDLTVTLSCKGGLRLTEIPASKKSPKVVLAKGPYKVAAGQQKTVTAKLTTKGQALLTSLLKGKGKPVPAKLTATLTGGATQSQTLQFP